MTLTALDLVDHRRVLPHLARHRPLLFAARRQERQRSTFSSGRDLPWWLAGTSMVATTFAADTPLAVAGFVARDGIAGNWIWWNAALGSMLTVFFFARLWRRAGIMTDVEFAELRYAGRPAAILRGFRALYLGLADQLRHHRLGQPRDGEDSRRHDGMGSADRRARQPRHHRVLLRAVRPLGRRRHRLLPVRRSRWAARRRWRGSRCRRRASAALAGLLEKLPASTFEFVPRVGAASDVARSARSALPLASFFAFIGVQWWASWYPGQEPGGGGYIAQRMMSARDERHSFFATLWFTIAHYCLRPWPWIVVGLASLMLYPALPTRRPATSWSCATSCRRDGGASCSRAFFAAYMSTISTQLNWGTSYIVNDFYRRFVRTDGTEQHYVWVSRFATIITMIAGGRRDVLSGKHPSGVGIRAWSRAPASGSC